MELLPGDRPRIRRLSALGGRLPRRRDERRRPRPVQLVHLQHLAVQQHRALPGRPQRLERRLRLAAQICRRSLAGRLVRQRLRFAQRQRHFLAGDGLGGGPLNAVRGDLGPRLRHGSGRHHHRPRLDRRQITAGREPGLRVRRVHGFDGSIKITASGTYKVCAYAIGKFENTSLGCKSVQASGVEAKPAQLPIGSYDSLSLRLANNSANLLVTGWALDPTSSATSIPVHVYVRSSNGSNPGYAFTANKARADVTVLGTTGNHGFSASVPISGPGSYTVCAYAISVAAVPIGNPSLGCSTLAVQPTPATMGHLDSATVRPPPVLLDQCHRLDAGPGSAGRLHPEPCLRHLPGRDPEGLCLQSLAQAAGREQRTRDRRQPRLFLLGAGDPARPVPGLRLRRGSVPAECVKLPAGMPFAELLTGPPRGRAGPG